MINILVVEDEHSIANLIKISLNAVGYNCEEVNDGEDAISAVESRKYDLILLDVMIPKLDGFSVLEYVKKMNIPVIFITALIDIDNKVKGLKLGAEDYITKPFDIKELLARVEVVLRRNNKITDIIKYRNIEVNLSSHVVTMNDKEIELTKKEFDILVLFLQNKNIALYRELIYERVWGEDFFGDTRTVDLHVARLKKKLDLEDEIKAVYKIGYRFEEKL